MFRRLSTELAVLIDRSRECNRARHLHVACDSHLPVGHLDDPRVDDTSLFAVGAGTAGGRLAKHGTRSAFVGRCFPRTSGDTAEGAERAHGACCPRPPGRFSRRALLRGEHRNVKLPPFFRPNCLDLSALSPEELPLGGTALGAPELQMHPTSSPT
jgi:hypothetical protein